MGYIDPNTRDSIMLRSLILQIFCTGWAAAVSSLTLVPCIHINGNPGFICGSYCFENYRWCLEDRPWTCLSDLGEEFLTNDTELCGDSLFWSNQTCDVFNYDDKIALGQRCSGGAQHCIYPWYLSGIDYNYKQVSEQLIIETSFEYEGTPQLFSHI